MSDPITDLKHELLAAAERQLGHAPAPVRHRRFRDRVRAPRLLLGGAAVAVAAAAALFITTPWSSSPSFLARAEAALTLPAGMIVHEKWVVTSGNYCRFRSTTELWLDAYSERVGGRRYRAIVPGPLFRDVDKPQLCSPESRYEVGGTTNGDVIRFEPPNRLVDTGLGGTLPQLTLGALGSDPVAALRHALRTGKARDEGRTKRHGRTVEHIRLEAGDAYVDPHTFYPVEIDLPSEMSEIGLPADEIRFQAYEYLPRTAANLALTNIRAQHPHASGP